MDHHDSVDGVNDHDNSSDGVVDHHDSVDGVIDIFAAEYMPLISLLLFFYKVSETTIISLAICFSCFL